MQEKKTKNQKNKDALKNWAKYSGLAFQMGFVIAAGTWAGIKLDERFNTSQRIYTLILVLLSVFIAIFLAIKDFILPKD